MITKERVLQSIEQNTFPKKHYSQANIEEISQSHLPQLLYWLDESLVLYEGKQFRWAKDPQIALHDHLALNLYTGDSYPTLVFLQDFMKLSFAQALYLLSHFYYKVPKAPLRKELRALETTSASSHALARPAADPASVDLDYILTEDRLAKGEASALRRTMAYLVNTRGLSREVVLNFIHQGFLKMDERYNLCFITYADPLEKDSVIAITRKGTTEKTFKGNQLKEPYTGFFYAPKAMLTQRAYEEVFVFESVIDLMAYLSLLQKGRITESGHAENRCYISLNGAANREYLAKVLRRNPTIRAVSLCLDNDQAGIRGTEEAVKRISRRPLERISDLREDGLKPISKRVGLCKDWGDVVRLPIHDLGVAV